MRVSTPPPSAHTSPRSAQTEVKYVTHASEVERVWTCTLLALESLGHGKRNLLSFCRKHDMGSRARVQQPLQQMQFDCEADQANDRVRRGKVQLFISSMHVCVSFVAAMQE